MVESLEDLIGKVYGIARDLYEEYCFIIYLFINIFLFHKYIYAFFGSLCINKNYKVDSW